MKKQTNKSNVSKSVIKQKPLKGNAASTSSKKVNIEKQVKKPTKKSKTAVDKIKSIENVSVKNIKAENQRLLRELEIEAALERVRARAMSMHHSEELYDLLTVLIDQFDVLGIRPAYAHLSIIDPTTNSFTFRMSGTFQNRMLAEQKIDINASPVWKGAFDQWKTGKYYIANAHRFPKEMLPEFWQLFTDILHLIPEELRVKTEDFPNGIYVTEASCKFGFLGYGHSRESTEEEKDIVVRFIKEFERSYQRFLDLQKAEAQARESQIQLALERVRARTMAMHYSSELADTATILFQQIKELGFEIWSCGFGIWKPEVDMEEAWMSTGDSFPIILIPFKDDPTHLSIYEAAQRGESVFEIEVKGEVLTRHYDWLMSQPSFKIAFSQIENSGIVLPTVQWKYAAFFKQGYLHLITTKPQPDIHDISSRFAKVFEQTYTRFLDLQKAETQAKEAQLETALEKVRSRTMAMFKSDELSDVAEVLFTQISQLGELPDRISIGIVNESNQTYQVYATDQAGTQLNVNFVAKLDEKTTIRHIYADWKAGKKSTIVDLQDDNLQDWINYIQKELGMPMSTDQIPGRRLHNVAHFSQGWLNLTTSTSLATEAHDMLQRFASVFNLTYTRFLDLQKAEAQAKEAQIEAALERVRATSMAMHKSEDMADASSLLFKELRSFGIQPFTCGFEFIDQSAGVVNGWITSPEGNIIMDFFMYPLNGDPVGIRRYKSWKRKEVFFKDVVKGKANREHGQFISKHFNESFKHITLEFPEEVVFYTFNFSHGWIIIVSKNVISDKHEHLLARFTKVFEQTYIRFLDLQKAEAQAKEAQIEAALERVRAQAMAMHHTEDLSKTIQVYFEQLDDLIDTTIVRCGAGLLNKQNTIADMSTASKTPEGETYTVKGTIDMRGHPLLDSTYDHWQQQREHSYVLRGNEIKEYYQFITNQVAIPENKGGDELHFYFPMFTEGSFYVVTNNEMPEDELQIFRRFSSVLSLTYRRFNDLQKAEAQAKEAQIEAALERVRSKTMAMHNSQDVGNTVASMFDQLVHLGVTTNRCGILIFSNTNTSEVWTAKSNPTGEAALIIGHLDLTIHPMGLGGQSAWKNKEAFYSYELSGDDIKNYYQAINNYQDYPTRFNLDLLPSKEIHSEFFFPEGSVFAFTSAPLSEGDALIFKRFAGVFGQTYRRYLDLLKAEAQARHAQIETAMEKVRARALAMQKPNELIEVAEVLRKEMGLLGVEELETSSIYLHDEASGDTECWYAIKKTKDDETKLVTDHMTIKLTDTWVGQQMLQFYTSDKKQISIPMQGDHRKEWINYCSRHSKAIEGFFGENIPDRTYHLIKFSNGYIGAASSGDISAESWDLLKRATSVFSLAYTRFNDLQIAEASTKEAVRRASLDRVRAEIASMRTKQDLERIIPLIWQELTTLGIPFVRCGVFIMDEQEALIHTFLSTPDGRAIAAFHLPYSTTPLVDSIEYWRTKKIYQIHWGLDTYSTFADSMVSQGIVMNKELYLSSVPSEGIYLHLLPFLQGMLYVGNTSLLTENDLSLIQSVAEAFSTAYARYEDFIKLEDAKKQIENTLTDLQSAQKQLIQSEKMASLGELTAGIAHEIQNPLNFVNNFSELNSELVKEIKQELAIGNEQLAKGNTQSAISSWQQAGEIINDIESNSEKINHHGKRAESIVKGMLEHSRKSTGVKEPTDINKLCDEFVRLSYHGLRAKNKDFNCDYKLDLDPNLPLINVVSQDIGRVLLNIINNAFQACSEKSGSLKLESQEVYKPLVTLTTHFVASLRRCEISISDNGPGIPSHIKDKIFQPFFTTKPTGQGTGLGLSLAYDIVKAHSGTIEVKSNYCPPGGVPIDIGMKGESKESVSTDFIIHLPLILT